MGWGWTLISSQACSNQNFGMWFELGCEAVDRAGIGERAVKKPGTERSGPRACHVACLKVSCGALYDWVGQVRRDDGVGSAPAEGARAGERQAEAVAGRGGARQGGVEGSVAAENGEPAGEARGGRGIDDRAWLWGDPCLRADRNLAVAVSLS